MIFLNSSTLWTLLHFSHDRSSWSLSQNNSEKRTPDSLRPSVRPYGTTRLPLDRISWNFTMWVLWTTAWLVKEDSRGREVALGGKIGQVEWEKKKTVLPALNCKLLAQIKWNSINWWYIEVQYLSVAAIMITRPLAPQKTDLRHCWWTAQWAV